MVNQTVSGFSVPQLVALERAIASGALRVSYEGKSTEYRSLDEMLRIRDAMRIALGIVPARSRTIGVQHNKGTSPFPQYDDTFSGF